MTRARKISWLYLESHGHPQEYIGVDETVSFENIYVRYAAQAVKFCDAKQRLYLKT